MSFETASLSFDEMVWSVFKVRNNQGFQLTDFHIPNPRDGSMPEEWRAQIKAEIEERARELELLREEDI